MPSIPASGPISMSMFNTVLGRASNTSNSSLAGGTTPAVGSQFYLANQSGSLNQTAPHAMSEWYGYTTTSDVTITIYSKQGVGGVDAGYDIRYAYPGCGSKGATWDVVPGPDCPNSDTCNVYGFITVPANVDISFAVLNCSGNCIYFNAADDTSTCPANSGVYCDCADCFGTPWTINSGTSNKNVAITVYASKLGYLACV